MIFKGWRWYQYCIYFFSWFIIFAFTLGPIFFLHWWPWVLTAALIIYWVFRLYMWLHRRSYLWRVLGRSIFFAGPRESGKGAVIALGVYAMDHFIFMKRKTPLSSIAIGNCQVVSPYYYFEHLGYDFKRMIAGWSPNRKLSVKVDDWEGRDYILLDGGIYFPSHEDQDLTRMFPATSNFIATAGHSYASALWTDSQNMLRLWIKLREQVADGFVLACGVLFTSRREFPRRIFSSIPWIRRYLVIKVRYYSLQESFEARMLPFYQVGVLDVAGSPLHVGAGLSNMKTFEAQHGIIKDYKLLVKRDWLRYDSRIFHELFFGYKSPTSQLPEYKTVWQHIKLKLRGKK